MGKRSLPLPYSAGFDEEMSDNWNDRSKPTERPLRFRQIVILAALVFAFAFAIRIAGGEPLPHDLRDFIARYLLGRGVGEAGHRLTQSRAADACPQLG
jgi:hypothetical protein